MVTDSKRFLAPAFLLLAAAFANAQAPEYRAPSDAWPRWSDPHDQTAIGFGMRTPAPDGLMHFATTVGYDLKHLRYGHSGALHKGIGFGGGFDNMEDAEVAYEELGEGLAVGAVDTIVAPDGTVHVFFFKTNALTDLDGAPWFPEDLYHVSRAPGGGWSAIHRLSTSFAAGGMVRTVGYAPGAASFTPSGDLAFYFTMFTTTYTPPEYPGDVWHPVMGSAMGQLYLSMNAVAGSPIPAAGIAKGPIFASATSPALIDELATHRGGTLWLKTVPDPTRPPPPGETSAFTRALVYVTPSGASTIASEWYLAGISSTSLFVDGSGAAHATWAELAMGGGVNLKHKAGSGSVETWASVPSGSAEGCMTQDANGIYHQFIATGLGTTHSVSADAASWSPGPAHEMTSPAPGGIGSLMADSQGRIFVGNIWTWEDNLGFQGGGAMLPAGPASATNAANGNFVLEIGLFGTAGHGPTAGMSLTYNTKAFSEGICGQNWSHTYLLHWQMGLLTLGDGRKIVFDYNGTDDAWYPRESYGLSAVVREIPLGYPLPSEWEMEVPSGAKWRFDGFGRPVKLTDRDLNALTLTYSDPGDSLDSHMTVLTAVTDAYGRVTEFHYDANDMLDYVLDPGGVKYDLTYSPATRQLVSIAVLAPGGSTALRTWQFQYYGLDGAAPASPSEIASITGLPNLMCSYRTPAMVAAAGAADDVWIGYANSGKALGRVNAVWDPKVTTAGVETRRHTEIAWEFVEPSGSAPTYRTRYADRRGKEFIYTVEDVRSLVLQVEDPVHGPSHPTVFEFDARRNVTSVTDPAGLRTAYTYVTPAEGLEPWVRDLVKTVKLPGDSAVTTYEYHPVYNAVTKIIPVTGATEATVLTYGSFGHLVSVLRPDDPAPSTFLYTTGGKLLQSIDPEGKKVTYTFGAYGLPSEIQVDGVKNSAGVPKPYKMAYNAMGQTVTSEQPFGGVTAYAYSPIHELDTVTPPPDSGGGSYSYLRDAAGRVYKTLDPNGNGSEVTLDSFGRTTATKNARGDFAYVFYDENHRVTDQTDFGGHVTHMEYDDLSRVVYSSRLVDATPEPDLYLITISEYDTAGNLVRETVKGSDDNPPPRVTQHFYDSKNLRTKTLLPGEDVEIRYGYDSKRQLIVEETYVLVGTEFEFYSGTFYLRDKQGRVVKQIQESEPWVPGTTPPGRETTMAYNGRGLVSTRTSHLGHTWTYLYDDAGRQVFQEDPTHVQTLTEYTEDGQVRGTDIAIPGFPGFQRPTTNVYNSRGQLVQTYDNINPADGVFSVYDNGGRLLSQSGPEGLYRSMTYDTLNRVQAEFTRKDATTTLRMDYKFDASGNMTRRYASPGEEAGGPFWEYAYNDGNRQSSATTPLGAGHPAYTRYDAVGNVVYQRDEDGNETFSVYDVKNRLTETTYRKPPAPGGAEGTGALWERVLRTYDPMGNLLAVEGELSGIRVEYQYRPDAPAADPHTHELYRATWMLAGVPWHTVTHGYDAEGRRVTTTVDAGLPGSHAQAFAYDDANRLLSITNDGTTQASFAYASGFLVTTTLGNGNRISRTYDAKGRLESLEHATAAGKTLAKIVYGYDKRDRRTTVQYPHLGIVSTFTYTDNSWLASESHAFSTAAPVFGNPEVAAYGGNASPPTAGATVIPAPPSGSGIALSISYTYDERGNRTAKDVAGTTTGDATYLYDLEDRLLSESRDGGATAVAYAWANRGDMVGRTKTTGAVVESESFVTDYLARITAYSGPTSSWQYIYAPTGDRIGKQHVGVGFEEDNQWDLISDGDVLASYHKSGASEVFDSIYVSPGIDGRLARIDGSGGASYYLNDALNSVHQVTSAGGALAGTDFNDAWGNPIDIGVAPPGGLNNRFSYTNRERDLESGLMFFRARSYDAALGRFTGRDPVSNSNLYCYVDNRPTTGTDPSGREVEVPDAEVDGVFQFLASRGLDAGSIARSASEGGRTSLSIAVDSSASSVAALGNDNVEREVLFRMLLQDSPSKRYRRHKFGSSSELEGVTERRVAVVLGAANWKGKLGSPQIPKHIGWEATTVLEYNWINRADPSPWAAIRSWGSFACGSSGAEISMEDVSTGCNVGTQLIALWGIATFTSMTQAKFDASSTVPLDGRDSGTLWQSLSGLFLNWFKQEKGVYEYDWVPGDMGYFKNGNPNADGFNLGENVVFVGGGASVGAGLLDGGRFSGIWNDGVVTHSMRTWLAPKLRGPGGELPDNMKWFATTTLDSRWSPRASPGAARGN